MLHWLKGSKEAIPLYKSEWITCKECHSDPAVNKSQVSECEQFLFNNKLKGFVDTALENKKNVRFPYAFLNECFKGTNAVAGKTVRYNSYPKPLEALVKRIVEDKELPTTEGQLKIKINEWADFFSTCLEMYFAAKVEGGRPLGSKDARGPSPTRTSKKARLQEDN
jgi:hypothetical protein